MGVEQIVNQPRRAAERDQICRQVNVSKKASRPAITTRACRSSPAICTATLLRHANVTLSATMLPENAATPNALPK